MRSGVRKQGHDGPFAGSRKVLPYRRVCKRPLHLMRDTAKSPQMIGSPPWLR